MLEVVTVTELVTESAIDTVTAVELAHSALELAGSDVLLTVAEPAPEIIEVG